MEFNPPLLSPFSLFSLVPLAISNFPLSLQLLLGRGAFPSPVSILSPPAKAPPFLRLLAPQVHLSILHTCWILWFRLFRLLCSSSDQFSRCAGWFVLVWLHFMDVRHTKNFHAVPPLWLLPKPMIILISWHVKMKSDNAHEILGTRDPEHKSCYHCYHLYYYIWVGRGEEGILLFCFSNLQTYRAHISAFTHMSFSFIKQRPWGHRIPFPFTHTMF